MPHQRSQTHCDRADNELDREVINFFLLWFGQHRYNLPTWCLRVTRYELLCKLSSCDKSAASAIRLRDRHNRILAEHFRFDGFSVEMLGRTGLCYREAGRKMFVDSEVLTGPFGMAVYKDTIKK